MSITRRQIGPKAQEWSSPRGSFRLERPASDILIYRAKGHLEGPMVELFVDSVSAALAEGTPHLFWDGEEMTGYDSKVRVRIGEHCVAVKARVASMNVYTPNRFVAMGASVINVWLGGFFNIVRTREELERLISEVRFAGLSGG